MGSHDQILARAHLGFLAKQHAVRRSLPGAEAVLDLRGAPVYAMLSLG